MFASIHPEWSELDSIGASIEGWDLFPSFNQHRPFWIERRTLDSLGVFASNEQAWCHVWKQAQSGSALHQRALDFLKKHSPNELAEVRRFGLGLNVQHNRFHPKDIIDR
jgi:hypothetical protein